MFATKVWSKTHVKGLFIGRKFSSPPSFDTGASQKLSHGFYVVATPIGNLEDITFRALRILRDADVVACEDTRTTVKLMNKFEISSKGRLTSLFEHSTPAKLDHLLREVASGKSVAIVSEAGTPLISDPGAELMAQAHENDLPVFAIPGPSSVTASLSVSGFSSDRFVFEGFLPHKRTKRKEVLQKLAMEDRTVVFFESPHRIEHSLADCVECFGSQRKAAIIRELTKIHEQVLRGPFGVIAQKVKEAPQGEFTIVVEGLPEKPDTAA